jgi:hypothetical protein
MDLGLPAGMNPQRDHAIPGYNTVLGASDLREDDGIRLLLRAREREPENGGAG